MSRTGWSTAFMFFGLLKCDGEVVSELRSSTVLFLSIVTCSAFAPLAHAEVVLAASVADNQGNFAHPFTFVSDFWPRNVPANYKQKHPFLEYHSFFNTFGSNPNKRSQHELYDETTPYPHYQFHRLTDHIDTVLAEGLKPYLTLGNCPIDLTSNQAIGFFNTMIYGPAAGKWDTYRDFVTAFFDDLNTKYGYDEVASWRYRFMTEQDNNQWWIAGPDEWFKFYDYTVSGARRANANVRISPGNLMRHAPGTYGTWLVPFANRIQNNIFSLSDEQTEKPDRVTFSLYSPWRVNQSSSPNVLSVDTSAIRAALAPYPMFDNIPLGIDEGYVGVDENDKTLWARVDGTEWGATHFAYLAQQMIDENWDVGSLWEPGDPDLPQPMRNVLEILDTMDGMEKITIPVTSGTPPSNNEVAALAATDGLTTKVMLANYHYWRTSSTPTDYRVRLTDLVPGHYKVTETRIDKDHGNYRTQWLIDSAGFPRQGDNSQYDMNPLAGLTDPNALALWNANYATYQAMANDMDMGTATYAVDSSGILEIAVQLPAHAVSFFTAVMSAAACDFDGGGCGLADINLMMAQGDLVAGVSASPGNQFNLNGDNVINEDDITEWLSLAGTTNGYRSPMLSGDTDNVGASSPTSRTVDITDFENFLAGFTGAGSTWDVGNFNGDGVVDITDFSNNFLPNFVATDGGTYGAGQLVPEPSAVQLLGLGGLLLAYICCTKTTGCGRRRPQHQRASFPLPPRQVARQQTAAVRVGRY